MTSDSLPPVQPPQLPSRRRRSLLGWLMVVAGAGLVALFMLLVLIVVVENWRGRRAWLAFKAEGEAQGERFEVKDFIPPTVPDAENFAATPFLAPLLAYTGRPVRWGDPEGRERTGQLSDLMKGAGGGKSPSPGNWEAGVFLDLEAWRDFLLGEPVGGESGGRSNAAMAVLSVLSPADAVLDELWRASGRPHSVFPIHYDENFDALLPHLSVIKSAAQVARLRALARLGVGRTDEALQDTVLMVRLGESVRSEPFLISQLVRIAVHQLALQPVWEGMARREWTEAQLRDLQQTLAGVQLLPDYGRSMRGERAFCNELLDRMRTGRVNGAQVIGNDVPGAFSQSMQLLPDGWFYHNQAVLNRLHQRYTLPVVDDEQRRVYPDRAALAGDIPELKEFSPYNVFSRLLLPAVAKSASKFAKAQTSLDLATVACALERHQRSRGRYPDRLEDLVPEHLAKLPADIISGEPLHYSRQGDGRFVIYSVGWNQQDDSGEPHRRRGGDVLDPALGDWAWQYPPK